MRAWLRPCARNSERRPLQGVDDSIIRRRSEPFWPASAADCLCLAHCLAESAHPASASTARVMAAMVAALVLSVSAESIMNTTM